MKELKKEWNRHAVIQLFQESANVKEGDRMCQYMRKQFPFLGIRSPLRKDLMKRVYAEFDIPQGEALLTEVEAIFMLPEREFQYVAIEMLDKRKKQLTCDDLAFCERLIQQKSWWDSVDIIAPKIVGTIVLNDRLVGEEVMRQWSSSQNMWLNRSAILHQLKYKEKMNEGLMFEIIQDHIESNEFFIQKSIGWVLREYAKTKPETVRSFVHSMDLKPLSRREALKHIG